MESVSPAVIAFIDTRIAENDGNMEKKVKGFVEAELGKLKEEFGTLGLGAQGMIADMQKNIKIMDEKTSFSIAQNLEAEARTSNVINMMNDVDAKTEYLHKMQTENNEKIKADIHELYKRVNDTATKGIEDMNLLVTTVRDHISQFETKMNQKIGSIGATGSGGATSFEKDKKKDKMDKKELVMRIFRWRDQTCAQAMGAHDGNPA